MITRKCCLLTLSVLAAPAARGLVSVSTPALVGKHKCLRIPCQGSPNGYPPVVLLGGTAQTINSWVSHFPGLSQEREVLVVELRGQGAGNDLLPPFDVGLQAQVLDLEEFFQETGLGEAHGAPVDLVGFSFGGRVAMAFAAARPESVHSCVVTSVAGARGGYGRLVLQNWVALLEGQGEKGGETASSQRSSQALENFAWSSILSSYHPEFLAKNEKRVPLWVRMVAETNTREGLHAIVAQTHGGDPTQELAEPCAAAGVRGKLIYGEQDLLCDIPGVPDFARAAGFELCGFEGCAHAVPMEEATKWRREVLAFLNK